MADHIENNTGIDTSPDQGNDFFSSTSALKEGDLSDPLSYEPRNLNDLSGNEAAQKAKRHRRWRVVLIVALIIILLALGIFAYIAYTYWNGQKAYDDLADQYFSAPEDGNLDDFYVDWDALRAINPDVVGWVYVPNTEISYPIAHRDGDDDYYLTHTFSNDEASNFGAEYGCIMLSGVNKADFSDEVNVIYGHNMANGSMFALFSKFYDSDTFNEHRTIYLLTPTGNYQLRSFAVNHVEGSDTSIVIPYFGTSEELEEYVSKRLENSVVEPDSDPPDPSSVNQVFAFSTCDGSNNTYRYVTFCLVQEYVRTAPEDSGSSEEALDGDMAADAEAGDMAAEEALDGDMAAEVEAGDMAAEVEAPPEENAQ